MLSMRFVKFIVVGLINTLFGYAVFSFLIYLGLHYSLALFIATIVGVLFNFKTTGKIVFDNTNNRLLFKFVTIYAVTYLINLTIVKTLLHYSFNIYVAGAISVIITALFSYWLNKELVFKEKRYEIN